MSPLAVSFSLAVFMALAAGGAFLYLRMLGRRSALSPSPFYRAKLEPAPPTKLIVTECSATYVPVDGPEFTGSFPPVAPHDCTRDIRGEVRGGQSPDLGLEPDHRDLDAPTCRHAKPVRFRTAHTIPRQLISD